MILLWLAAILSRNAIRAHWWVHRLSVAESATERLGYFYRLASLGDRAVPAVAGLLRCNDPGLRSFAVGVLHHAPGGEAFELLRQACRDVDLDVVRLAVQGLAMRGNEKSIAELAAVAANGDQRRAMIATAALADTGSDSASDALIGLLESSPHPGVRVQAIEGLRMLRTREAIEPLIDALDMDAVFEGVTEGDRKALHAFEAATADLDRQGRLPTDTAIHVPDRHIIRQRAEQALQAITGHSFDFTAEDRAQGAVVAQAWRNWWHERQKSKATLPP